MYVPVLKEIIEYKNTFVRKYLVLSLNKHEKYLTVLKTISISSKTEKYMINILHFLLFFLYRSCNLTVR